MRPDVRIVFCTGIPWFKQTGNSDVDLHVLRKPFTLQALLAALGDRPVVT